jgi:hypothetical protein
MGQHKYNQTAQLAKEGKLPKKPSKISKQERARLFEQRFGILFPFQLPFLLANKRKRLYYPYI